MVNDNNGKRTFILPTPSRNEIYLHELVLVFSGLCSFAHGASTVLVCYKCICFSFIALR